MYDLLKGLTVVEGSAFVAGPTCGLYLAQLGAEVIRFGSIGGGDDAESETLEDRGEDVAHSGVVLDDELGAHAATGMRSVATAPRSTPGSTVTERTRASSTPESITAAASAMIQNG